MLYNLCLYLKGFFITSAATVLMLVFLITFVKEKRDERKRA